MIVYVLLGHKVVFVQSILSGRLHGLGGDCPDMHGINKHINPNVNPTYLEVSIESPSKRNILSIINLS